MGKALRFMLRGINCHCLIVWVCCKQLIHPVAISKVSLSHTVHKIANIQVVSLQHHLKQTIFNCCHINSDRPKNYVQVCVIIMKAKEWHYKLNWMYGSPSEDLQAQVLNLLRMESLHSVVYFGLSPSQFLAEPPGPFFCEVLHICSPKTFFSDRRMNCHTLLWRRHMLWHVL